MDPTFLDRRDRRTVALAICSLTLIGAGWKVRDLIGNAQAAEVRVNRLERSINRMDKNMVAIATKLNVAIETETDEDVAAARVGP